MPDPATVIALVAVAGLLLALVAARRQRADCVCRPGGAVCFGRCAWRFHSSPRIERGSLEITAIDVGQGDSLLVVSPEGQNHAD